MGYCSKQILSLLALMMIDMVGFDGGGEKIYYY
jgi:hypothetical protein